MFDQDFSEALDEWQAENDVDPWDDESMGSARVANFIPNASPVYDYCKATMPSTHMYSDVPNGKLMHVQVIIRHGDRTPLWKTSSSDTQQPFDCTNPLSGQKNACMPGSLTKQGFAMHEQLGQELRALYVDKLRLMPPTLTDAALLMVRSTNTERTKYSAYAVLFGLFPPKTARTVSSIPILIRPKERESIVAPDVCKKRNVLYNRMTTSPTFKSIVPNPALRQVLSDTMPLAPAGQIVAYSDTLNARTCHHMKLPCNGARCSNEKARRDIHAVVEAQQTCLLRGSKESAEVNRLGYGVLMNEIWDGMRAVMETDRSGNYSTKTADTKRPVDRFRLFSGHDDTLYGLLGLVMAEVIQWPPYAANLVFELWKVGKKYSVRLLYNGIPLKTKEWDFSTPMDIKKFRSWLRNKIVSDLDMDCDN
jgi:hypothetical protein